MGITELHNLYK